jgi:hypothetical protein
MSSWYNNFIGENMFNFEELKKLDEKQKLAVHCL